MDSPLEGCVGVRTKVRVGGVGWGARADLSADLSCRKLSEEVWNKVSNSLEGMGSEWYGTSAAPKSQLRELYTDVTPCGG